MYDARAYKTLAPWGPSSRPPPPTSAARRRRPDPLSLFDKTFRDRPTRSAARPKCKAPAGCRHAALRRRRDRQITICLPITDCRSAAVERCVYRRPSQSATAPFPPYVRIARLDTDTAGTAVPSSEDMPPKMWHNDPEREQVRPFSPNVSVQRVQLGVDVTGRYQQLPCSVPQFDEALRVA